MRFEFRPAYLVLLMPWELVLAYWPQINDFNVERSKVCSSIERSIESNDAEFENVGVLFATSIYCINIT